MVRKKIDNRIRVLIENGVAERHRTMFVVIGDHGRDQVCYCAVSKYNKFSFRFINLVTHIITVVKLFN